VVNGVDYPCFFVGYNAYGFVGGESDDSTLAVDNSNGGWSSNVLQDGYGRAMFGAFSSGYTQQLEGQVTINGSMSDPSLSDLGSAHLVLENDQSQTLFVFSFNNSATGGVRGDSSGNFNWHATGSQGHQFYNTIDDSDPYTKSISTNGFLFRAASATGAAANYPFEVQDSGGSTLAYIDSSGNIKGAIMQPTSNYKSVDGSSGDTTTVTTSSLVGKTMTFKNGLLVSFA
jgi:hypothetical protein